MKYLKNILLVVSLCAVAFLAQDKYGDATTDTGTQSGFMMSDGCFIVVKDADDAGLKRASAFLTNLRVREFSLPQHGTDSPASVED
jgi:hypothetical protein